MTTIKLTEENSYRIMSYVYQNILIKKAGIYETKINPNDDTLCIFWNYDSIAVISRRR